MKKEHSYEISVQWEGNTGKGTWDYASYARDYIISKTGKQEILASSDPSFRGDKTRYNPEELLIASLSGCHMLWYLHLCSEEGIVVVDYTDSAGGTMIETPEGSGYFVEAVLRPVVIVADASMIEKANALHERANKMCFIANSCKFPVYHEPICKSF